MSEPKMADFHLLSDRAAPADSLRLAIARLILQAQG